MPQALRDVETDARSTGSGGRASGVAAGGIGEAGVDGEAGALAVAGVGSAGVWGISAIARSPFHGLTSAKPTNTTATRTTAAGATSERRRPTRTGSNRRPSSGRRASGSIVALTSEWAAMRRRPEVDGSQLAAGTTRPWASIVAARRSLRNSAPGTWSRAW